MPGMFGTPEIGAIPVMLGVFGWLLMPPKPCITPMGRGRIIAPCPNAAPPAAPTPPMGGTPDIMDIMPLLSQAPPMGG